MNCASCGSGADDPVTKCEQCGYNPRLALGVSGIVYWMILSMVSLSVAAVLLTVTDRNAIGSALSVPFLLGIPLFSYYGSYLVVIGFRAPVNDDLSGYRLPILEPLAGGRSDGKDKDDAFGRTTTAEGQESPTESTDARNREVGRVASVECISCDVRVGEGAMRCPNCGYYPMKSLAASGPIYFLSGAMTFLVGGGISALAIARFGAVGAILIVFPLIGALLLPFGIWTQAVARNATVDRNLERYALPVLR